MFKRLSIVISAIAVLGMILTACGPAASTYTCTDTIGCVTIAPTDPIHIAYLLSVTGANAALGVDSRNGVEIAIDDAGGKILNHTIKFDGEDGGNAAPKADRQPAPSWPPIRRSWVSSAPPARAKHAQLCRCFLQPDL